MSDSSSSTGHGSVIAGACLATAIIVVSGGVAMVVGIAFFADGAGSFPALALLAGSPLAGLLLAASILYRRHRHRTLIGMAIVSFVTTAFFAVMIYGLLF